MADYYSDKIKKRQISELTDFSSDKLPVHITSMTDKSSDIFPWVDNEEYCLAELIKEYFHSDRRAQMG